MTEPAKPALLHWSLRTGLLGLATLYYWAVFFWHPVWLRHVGIIQYKGWFLDAFALLASSDAAALGLDPYAPNPLDYFHRAHVYSHWWLHLHDLGLTRADVVWVGAALGAAFLLTALWRLRPGSPGQFFWYLAVLCSSPVILGVDRANNDLVIFILLAPLVPCLLSRHGAVRLLAPLLVTVAAMLKYYPAAAGLLLLAAASRREVRARVAVTLGLLVLAAWGVAGDLAHFGQIGPRPEGLMSFGAVAFFNTMGWGGWVPKAAVVCLGLAVVAVCWFRRVLQDWRPAPEWQSDWLHFVLGAVLLTGCFFLNMNYGYRWIFALWMAPFLWAVPDDPAAARLARWLRWLLLLALWWDPVCCFILNRLTGALSGETLVRLSDRLFIAGQPIDWAFFLGLLVFLTQFARQGVDRLRAGDLN
jgi:hypothetical protein